ncbi:MAG: hypothetical protein NC408_02100 [Candidatus Gastranaerophilales bacterium]|nr:hypothetical protein [Candidatus Gastranaerophilales bacterium]MCM1073840.1 hypothetical protein [Bacteroides sp.]
MIAPVNSAVPSFKAIYQSRDYMKPEQAEIADNIVDILTSDKYKNEKGKTLEEQAGVKADVFISSPKEDKSVNVFLIFSRYIDTQGEKFGRRSIHNVGTFDKNNIQKFPDEFRRVNFENNSEKIENRTNLAAVILSGLALLAAVLFSGEMFKPKVKENAKPMIEKVITLKDSITNCNKNL